ncbi:MAG: carbamoyltransferase [Parcubacteria group bacterium Gr01-1014_17]|nr:MAG: carbamoyltransferase [Parcubacteria group bacterium Gr01-1014_17]
MNILGLKIKQHDTGAALIAGNRVVAIAEERLNRVKHSRDMFPNLSIEYCLNTLCVRPEEVDLVVLDQVGSHTKRPSEVVFKRNGGGRFTKARVETINHHDAHAAAAFFCSPFLEAGILIVDGVGETLRDNLGALGTETETIYRGDENHLVMLQKTRHLREMLGFPYTTGIGKLYSFISDGYLNFGDYNEGKMMGLAPYGDGRILEKYPLSRWFRIDAEGRVLCNPLISFAGREESKGFRQKSYPQGWLRWFLNEALRKTAYGLFRAAYRRREPSLTEPILFDEIHLRKPRRKAETLPEPYYAAAAYAVQKVLEEVMVVWGKRIKSMTGVDNLCLAGGVGLNIDANRRFLEDVGFKKLFVQPAASDTGIALGCALWGAHQILRLPRFYEMKSASLGKTYLETDITNALEKYKDKITARRSNDFASDAAKLIASGKIIGWFQGGSEYGPRALGNRSIIGDARNPEMANIINKKVKHREPWRPFAASVLAEKQREWFELEHPSPFMLLAAPVMKEKRALVPSIVHIDGSCRIQSVTAEANEPYYALLKVFEKETGVPLVLNTSFNDAGEPIVETPEDALRCFLNTEMDALVLHNWIVEKK